MRNTLSAALIATLSLGLAACGSDSKNNDTKDPVQPDAGNKQVTFAEQAVEFTADFNNDVSSVCYDIDSKKAVDCATSEEIWDVRFDNNFSIWLNGGVHGKGDGGAFGPNTLANMRSFKNGSGVPGIFKDKVGGAFLENSWYAYSLEGKHKLWPNYRVYVVKGNNDKYYKIRLLSYYAPQESSEPKPGTSGVITFEYQDISEGSTTLAVRKTVDASAGGFRAAADDPKNKYTYFNFARGEVVELTDKEAESSEDWDIAFKRTSTKLNSSNPIAKTEGALAEAQADFYDDKKEAIKDKFLNATAASEQAEFDGVDHDKAKALDFIKDAPKPYLEKSWYSYDPVKHQVSAKADQFWVIRGAEKKTFAIFNVTAIKQNGRQAGSYTVNFYPEVTK